MASRRIQADPAALPGWPAVLHEAWAAAYLSLSTSTFRARVVPEVPPISLSTRRQGWRRSDLDAWIARQAGEVPGSDLHNPWDDP